MWKGKAHRLQPYKYEQLHIYLRLSSDHLTVRQYFPPNKKVDQYRILFPRTNMYFIIFFMHRIILLEKRRSVFPLPEKNGKKFIPAHKRIGKRREKKIRETGVRKKESSKWKKIFANIGVESPLRIHRECMIYTELPVKPMVSSYY